MSLDKVSSPESFLLPARENKTRPGRRKKTKNICSKPVDIVFEGCYSYHDRRSTTVIATPAVATTVVTKLEGDRSMAEISSDVIRGYNDIIILYMLLNDPSYGYEISKEIRTLSEDKYIIKDTPSGVS